MQSSLQQSPAVPSGPSLSTRNSKVDQIIQVSTIIKKKKKKLN